jgi:hypothetical protein
MMEQHGEKMREKRMEIAEHDSRRGRISHAGEKKDER